VRIAERVRTGRGGQHRVTLEQLKPRDVMRGDAQLDHGAGPQRPALEQDAGVLDARIDEQALAIRIDAELLGVNGSFVEMDGHATPPVSDRLRKIVRENAPNCHVPAAQGPSFLLWDNFA